MEDEAVIGTCLCGAFQFQISAPLGEVRLCHCDLCRRANGSAYSANSKVPLEQFRIISQTAPTTAFQSSPGAWKHFCSTCGSPVYSKVDWDVDHVRVRLGTLPRDTKASIVAHVWVGSKADWDTIADDLPKFDRAAE